MAYRTENAFSQVTKSSRVMKEFVLWSLRDSSSVEAKKSLEMVWCNYGL